jgi:hypothetical protein
MLDPIGGGRDVAERRLYASSAILSVMLPDHELEPRGVAHFVRESAKHYLDQRALFCDIARR